jgi:thiol:disulfide interchange protein
MPSRPQSSLTHLLASNRRPRMASGLSLAAIAVLAVAALVSSGAARPWFGAIGSASAQVAGKHIYSETANPSADITAALAQAKQEHKRVLVDFGGDWCGDCQVLDIYLHQQPNADLLQKHFLLVHVWIGHIDANLDVPAKYGIPINKGVPALAVLDADGKVIYAQKTGEFEDMRHMESNSVTEFLEKWKS